MGLAIGLVAYAVLHKDVVEGQASGGDLHTTEEEHSESSNIISGSVQHLAPGAGH
tara:strand:+ start:184 stop:348 length:165 start_codon:yes stop_codon:yes gene_type:complete